MTYPAHVLAGIVIYRACGPAVGIPLAVASHFVLDGACRFHPDGMEWPWLSDTTRRLMRMLWAVNIAATLAILFLAGFRVISAGELWLGGVLVGWLSHDVFHVIRALWPGSPLLRLDPHRLTDWMRARWWPRNGEEPWGAWMEAGLIALFTILAVFTKR